MADYISTALSQYEDLKRRNTENTEAYKNSVSAVYDQQADIYRKQAESDMDTTSENYKGLYDRSALQQLVNERELKQRQASLGLTDSGLTKSQLTAIQVSRGNTDANIDRQKQAAIDSINQQLDAYIAQVEMNRSNALATADYELNSMNNNMYQTLMSNAYSSQAAYDAAQLQAAATEKAAQIKASSTLETKLSDSYYKRAKYLLEHNSDEAAINYIESLDLDVADRARLRLSLGLCQASDRYSVVDRLSQMKNYNDKMQFLLTSLKEGTITQGEYNTLAYRIGGRSRKK